MADPLIAIIGSVHPARADELKLKDAPAGEKAAEVIGHALVKQGCRIVTYSDEDWSVEPLVVKGYVAEYNANSTLKDKQSVSRFIILQMKRLLISQKKTMNKTRNCLNHVPIVTLAGLLPSTGPLAESTARFC